jgi:hypothetical protein
MGLTILSYGEGAIENTSTHKLSPSSPPVACNTPAAGEDQIKFLAGVPTALQAAFKAVTSAARVAAVLVGSIVPLKYP